jgi:hemolysin III
MSLLNFREPVNAWTHGIGLLFSLPITLLLWRLCRGNRLKQLGLLVFGISLACCYAGSMLYHGACLPPEQLDWFARLDFIGVYLLIAGTFTPVVLVVLRGRWRTGILGTAWALAAFGIGLRLAGVEMSSTLSTGLYLVMGWALFVGCGKMACILPLRDLGPAMLGGLLYTVGAVLNHLRWPVLWPHVFSTHELWHLFVMAGSASHCWLMLRVVVPFEAPGCRLVQAEP